jgi:hypothetical protein
MLLNILYFYYIGNINKQNLNKIFIIAFIGYTILNFYFKKYIHFIGIFDALYFVFHFIELKLESKEKENNTLKDKNHEKPLINNLINSIKKIDISTFAHEQTDTDPELQLEKFKPYEYNIKGTITELMNNIST